MMVYGCLASIAFWAFILIMLNSGWGPMVVILLIICTGMVLVRAYDSDWPVY